MAFSLGSLFLASLFFINAVAILNPGSALSAEVVVTFIDVTARKRIEQARQKAGEDRRLAVVLLDGGPDDR